MWGLNQVRLTLIWWTSWLILVIVQIWMTWTLMLLLTFPGCLCNFFCHGEDHEEPGSHQDGTTFSCYCDAEEHEHRCSHSEEQYVDSIISKSQVDLPFPLGPFNSKSLHSSEEFRSKNKFQPFSTCHSCIRDGRHTLRLCNRLIIWSPYRLRNQLRFFNPAEHADSWFGFCWSKRWTQSPMSYHILPECATDITLIDENEL